MRAVAVALAVLVLSGCASSLDSAYDEHARSECARDTGPRERGNCLDHVDQNRRDRER